MAALLKVKNLTREYAPGKGAIDIELEVSPGEIVGFIGPNGAGKTTTISMLLGLIKSDKGEITILDKNIESFSDYPEVYARIGFLSADPAYYDKLTPRQMFRYKSQLHQDPNVYTRALELAERLELDIDKQIKKLSTGNKRKTGVVLAVAGTPKLLILDEPTTGLDPIIQKEVLSFLTESTEKEAGVFLSSHNLSEVESICDRIIIIKDAHVVFSGMINEIKAKAQKKVKFKTKTIEEAEKLLAEMLNRGGISKHNRFHNSVEILTPEAVPFVEMLLKLKIHDFTVENPTLEEMFLDYYK